jgi:hypothetical protein
LYQIEKKKIINFTGKIRKELCPPVQMVHAATIVFHRYICPETFCPEFLFLAKKTVKNCTSTKHIHLIFLFPCVKGGIIMKIPGPIFVQGGGN